MMNVVVQPLKMNAVYVKEQAFQMVNVVVMEILKIVQGNVEGLQN